MEKSTPDQKRRRMLARAAIDAGHLPSRVPGRIWGGHGVDADCAVCGITIPRDEKEFAIEISIEAPINSSAVYVEIFHFHVPCFAAWEFELP